MRTLQQTLSCVFIIRSPGLVFLTEGNQTLLTDLAYLQNIFHTYSIYLENAHRKHLKKKVRQLSKCFVCHIGPVMF